MTATTLDGKATLATIKGELRERIAALKARGITPGLGTVLVGDDPGSQWYVNAKHKDCAEVGITSIRKDLPATATQAEVEAVIDELNDDENCTGFLIQQPTGLDEVAPPDVEAVVGDNDAGRGGVVGVVEPVGELGHVLTVGDHGDE